MQAGTDIFVNEYKEMPANKENTMSQKVHLTLTGQQKDETGEIARTEHSGDAEYFEKNDCVYLLYEESPNGSDTIVKNTLKLKHSVLELTRRGGISARMVFEPGREYLTDYTTPYGCLKMGIFTHSLDVFREDCLLRIRIVYSLTSYGLPVSDCTLDIAVCFSH